ncbi:Bug family tripartite tricarboxylate transporter substrate binding protein [Pseudoroseomonas ludipueritiae]|uniref:Tripartite tricarboxylate transporter substrate binding protein n=1 Tax=Pseudoroseomonas ludipueritiae TaxID=198093 RepID=A0ABR7R594_9PROT|nr:tripartite tricarboxylate transporter substrate binding protein [Pseudoroseomonas ludipueritiae]MBC9176913.1 tripartite tricarboxylate transporter substrate binding protein [Pseudoroseomonas ludipueritiae]
MTDTPPPDARAEKPAILRRRALLTGAVLAPLAMPGLISASQAQGSGSIRLIVPFAPGGATDSSARAMSDRLSAVLGRSIVVENRSGGGGSIGAAAAAQARPDGNTLLLDTIVHLVNPLVLRGLPLDYRTAFTPISQVTRIPLALAVKADSPARDLAGFVAMAKAAPGQISCGHAGNATAAHLASALLQLRAGIQLNDTPYRGGAEASRDLASGTLDAVFVALLSVAPVVQSGRARMLAVASPTRTALQPDVPTLSETYPNTALDEWTGLFAPAGTPPDFVNRVQAALAEVLRDPEVLSRLAQLGAEPIGSTPADFARFLQEGRVEAEKLVREAKIELG